MTETQTDARQLLESAVDVAERVRAAGARIEAERRIPVELSDELADKGFFGCCCPDRWGARNWSIPTSCESCASSPRRTPAWDGA